MVGCSISARHPRRHDGLEQTSLAVDIPLRFLMSNQDLEQHKTAKPFAATTSESEINFN